MAALSADRITHDKGRVRRRVYKVKGSTVIYCGALVCTNGGYAVPAADTAGLGKCVGVAVAKADNSAGADGDITVTVDYAAEFLLDVGASITQVDVNAGAYASDDQTVIDVGAATNDIYVGQVRQYVAGSPNKAWVYIPGDGR